MGEVRFYFLWNAAGIAFRRALPGMGGEGFMRRGVGRVRLVGIFVSQFIEGKPAPGGNFKGPRHRVFIALVEALNFGPALEMAFRIGAEAIARLGDPAFLADAGEHILQRLAFRRVIEAVADAHQRRAYLLRKPRKPRQTARVSAVEQQGRAEKHRAGKIRPQRGERFAHGVQIAHPREKNENLPLAMAGDVIQPEMTHPLGRAAVAACEQFAQASIGRPVRGQADNLMALAKHQPRAGNKLSTKFLRLHMTAHDPGKAVAVGDGDGFEPQRMGLGNHLAGVRGAAQKTEIAGRGQFRITAHGNSPCMNHWQGASRRSLRPRRKIQKRVPAPASTRK